MNCWLKIVQVHNNIINSRKIFVHNRGSTENKLIISAEYFQENVTVNLRQIKNMI